MGVYIKGIEMPTDCHNCPLGFGGGCYCGTSADEYMCPDHGRAEWCPLVSVPPHGDLIDRDVLIQSKEIDSFGAVFAVAKSPTVIPADPAKEADP